MVNLNQRIARLEASQLTEEPNALNKLLWSLCRRDNPKLPESPPPGEYDNRIVYEDLLAKLRGVKVHGKH